MLYLHGVALAVAIPSSATALARAEPSARVSCNRTGPSFFKPLRAANAPNLARRQDFAARGRRGTMLQLRQNTDPGGEEFQPLHACRVSVLAARRCRNSQPGRTALQWFMGGSFRTCSWPINLGAPASRRRVDVSSGERPASGTLALPGGSWAGRTSKIWTRIEAMNLVD